MILSLVYNNMEFSLKVLILIVFVILANFIYNDYLKSEKKDIFKKNNELIDRYLISNIHSDDPSKRMNKAKGKPLLWIFIDNEKNARNWDSFYSRSNNKLNKPYQIICMKSIVDKCNQSFDICLIDKSAFSILIPPELQCKVKCPIAYKIISLYKILYIYGGILVPSSFLCIKDLFPIYESSKRNAITCFEVYNSNIAYNFVACERESELINKFIEYQEYISSDDKHSSNYFGIHLGNWLNEHYKLGNINLVDGKKIGIKNKNDDEIHIGTLLGINAIDYDSGLLGIYIDAENISKYTKYQWFDRMSTDQILDSNLAISQYILASY
jgi:hypothetical protein